MTTRPDSRVVAVDTAFTTLAEVEHALLDLGRSVELPDDVTVCTHEVRDTVPHYAVSFAWVTFPAPDLINDIERHFHDEVKVSGANDAAGAAPSAGIAVALAQTRDRDGGRAVRFPGWQRLRGTVIVADALRVSAIDRVHQLGGGRVDTDAQLHTRGFVRPRWRDGDLVLAVLPAPGGAVAPFEVPNPTPCCASHS